MLFTNFTFFFSRQDISNRGFHPSLCVRFVSKFVWSVISDLMALLIVLSKITAQRTFYCWCSPSDWRRTFSLFTVFLSRMSVQSALSTHHHFHLFITKNHFRKKDLENKFVGTDLNCVLVCDFLLFGLELQSPKRQTSSYLWLASDQLGLPQNVNFQNSRFHSTCALRFYFFTKNAFI